MKQELQKNLFQKYPKIFTQRNLPSSESGMCYGIQCPDEWYDIIDTLCNCISQHIKYKELESDKQVDRWSGSLQPVNIERLKCEAKQVKSKFGQLRFYVTGADDYIRGAIAVAEMLSIKINK